MSNNNVQVLFPPGRLVDGSMTNPQTTDAENKPLKVKSGPNAGQERVDYFFAVAIPKGGETAWTGTPWGAAIYNAAAADFNNPGILARPDFAWKVTDGDSGIPNRRGRKPNSREGYPGHWVVRFGSGFAPKTVNSAGTAPVDPAGIKLGHFVQVFGSVGGNESQNQPGVFLNHIFVAHTGYGKEIFMGPDPTTIGFGQGPMPAGMSATPVAGVTAAHGAVTPPPATGAVAPPLGGVVAPPAVATVPTIPTVPNAGILAPPPTVARVPIYTMTPKAAGASREQYLATPGWTDELLVQHGMMTVT